MDSERLQKIIASSEGKIKRKVSAKLENWKKELKAYYQDNKYACIEDITFSLWIDYYYPLLSREIFADSIESITGHTGLTNAEIDYSEGRMTINLSHISFVIDTNSKAMAPKSFSGHQQSLQPIPNISADELVGLILTFNNVARCVNSQATELIHDLEKERIIENLIIENIKARKEELLNCYNIVSFIEYETAPSKFPRRVFSIIKYPTVRCSFAMYRQLATKLSRDEAMELLSNPTALLEKMKFCKKRPYSLSLFSKKEQKIHRPCEDDSFLKKMKKIVSKTLKPLGITVVITLMKKEVKLVAVQYMTTRSEYIEPDKSIEFLQDIDGILNSMIPFKHRVNFIGKDPNRYGDNYSNSLD